AHAAAGGRVEMALEAVEIDLHARRELDPDDVDEAVRRGRAARADGGDVVGGADDAFGVQEADGELDVLAGRAHRDGDALLAMLAACEVAEADLEGLLRRNDVARDEVVWAGRAEADPADLEMPNALPAQGFLYADHIKPEPAPPRGERRPSQPRTRAR